MVIAKVAVALLGGWPLYAMPAPLLVLSSPARRSGHRWSDGGFLWFHCVSDPVPGKTLVGDTGDSTIAIFSGQLAFVT
jgi:hypothetical protein